MLILLPIEFNGKSINITFQVTYNNKEIIVKPYNNIILFIDKIIPNLYKIILCSKTYGINTFIIHFPLVFTCVSNVLICDLFYAITILYGSNDFFSLLLDGINSHYNTQFYYFNSKSILSIISTIKLNVITDIEGGYTNVESLINKVFYKSNRYLNFCLSIMSSSDNYNITSKKISNILKLIKNINCIFYGTKATIKEHIDNIKNFTINIKPNQYYFISNKNKIIKLFVTKVTDNTIYCKNNIILQRCKECPFIVISDVNIKYTITTYPPKFSEYIVISRLIEKLVLSHYNEMILIIANIIYKKTKPIIELLSGIYSSSLNVDNMINLKLLTNIKNIEEQYSYIYDNISYISYELFKSIIACETAFNYTILENLFIHYKFPLNYNKKALNLQFIKILYYSFKHYNEILNGDMKCINSKIKSVYLYILKTYKSLKEDEKYDIMYNSRLYTDSMVNQIIKILLFGDLDLLQIQQHIKNIIDIFIKNLILI